MNHLLVDQPPPALARRCDRCGSHFNARVGSGGSPQRFCTPGCRRTFNGERQRSQRSAPYAGPTSPPATERPAQNETLCGQPRVAALHHWETGELDVAGCDRTEFVLALAEGEAAGSRFATWPLEIQALMDVHVSRWVEENKMRTVCAITVAAPTYSGIQCCVLILHHKPKG